MDDLLRSYGDKFFVGLSKTHVNNYKGIFNAVMEFANPRSVLDVGAGCCYLINLFAAHEIQSIAIDGSPASEKFADNVVSWHHWDGRHGVFRCEPVDCVVSTETAEHIPPEFEENVVDTICDNSRRWIVFGAAFPGQTPGPLHPNEQTKEHWIERFSLKGFVFSEELTLKGQDILRGAGAKWHYVRNHMTFYREEAVNGSPN